MEQSLTKTYITVTVQISLDGSKKPLSIMLEDGRHFDIDEVIDTRRAASLKVGGCGMRHTIRIGSSITYLFDEDGRWFVGMKG